MTLPNEYLKAVREDIYVIKMALRSGNLVEAFEAVQQCERQITHSIDEIERITS